MSEKKRGKKPKPFLKVEYEDGEEHYLLTKEDKKEICKGHGEIDVNAILKIAKRERLHEGIAGEIKQ